MFFKLKQFFYSKILNRKYFREGKCLACGRCCTKIYVRHAKNVIKDEKEFENLKKGHFFYRHLEIIDKDDLGLVFECKRLDKETGKCLAHKQRPSICRKYPQEEIFMIGGGLAENCGYKFTPVIPFDEVFKKICNK